MLLLSGLLYTLKVILLLSNRNSSTVQFYTYYQTSAGGFWREVQTQDQADTHSTVYNPRERRVIVARVLRGTVTTARQQALTA